MTSCGLSCVDPEFTPVCKNGGHIKLKALGGLGVLIISRGRTVTAQYHDHRCQSIISSVNGRCTMPSRWHAWRVSTVSRHCWERGAHLLLHPRVYQCLVVPMMFVTNLIHLQIVNIQALSMRTSWTWTACEMLSLPKG